MKESIIYILVFSFLLAGCYTTDNYSDTPRNIISGKSKIELNDDFVLDSLTLKSNIKLKLQNYFTQFIDCNKDTCGKLLYGRIYEITDTTVKGDKNQKSVLLKKSIPDTIAVSNISKMFYHRGYYDYEIIVIGLIAIAGVLYFFFNAFKHFGKP
jgi:hypothetical protein